MAPKEDLFKLIKSLSRSEKRYFTIDAQKGGAKNSNYLSLFKAINSMETYGETDIKKEFPNLSMDKAYLYEAILKSMRDYRSPKSKRAQLKQYIIDSKFLHEKGQLDQCANRLKTAKAVAHELGDSLSLLEINREESRLSKAKNISDFNLEFDDFKKVKDIQLHNLEDEFFFFDVYEFLIEEVQIQFVYNNQEKRKNLQIKYNPNTWEEPQNAQAKLRFFQAKALFHQLIGKFELAAKYYSKAVEVWNEYPLIKNEEGDRYIVDLSNLISICFGNKEFERAGSFIEKLKNQKPKNLNEESLHFRNLMKHELSFYFATSNFSKLDEMSDTLKEGLSKYSMPPSTQMTLIFQMASMFLYKNDFHKSRDWAKNILDFKKGEKRIDIQKAAIILYLLMVAETKDYDPIVSAFRSAERIFKTYFEEEEVVFEKSFLSKYKTIVPFPLDKKDKKGLKEFIEEEKKKITKSMSLDLIEGWMNLQGL